MNFDWHEGEEEQLREDVCLMNMRTHEVFSDKLSMAFLKIPLMNKDAEECRGMLERWIYILKNMDKMEAMPKVFLNDPIFRRLREVAKVAALDGRGRAEYEASLKSYRDTYAVFMTATREGYAEGKAEGQLEEKKATARKLLEAGMDADFVKGITGLDVNSL